MNARSPFLLRTALAVCAITMAATGVAADDKSDAPSTSITADRMRAAFLEDAPKDAAKSMQEVAAEECERIRDEPLQNEAGEPIDVAWLCGGKSLRYLREVLLDGTKVDDGYICDPAGLETMKFLPLDVIEHQRCVWVSYDYGAKVHDLDLDSQLGAAATDLPIVTEAKP